MMSFIGFCMDGTAANFFPLLASMINTQYHNYPWNISTHKNLPCYQLIIQFLLVHSSRIWIFDLNTVHKWHCRIRKVIFHDDFLLIYLHCWNVVLIIYYYFWVGFINCCWILVTHKQSGHWQPSEPSQASVAVGEALLIEFTM